MWLTGEATWLATPGRAEEFILAEATALAELRDLLLAEATLTVCTQCAARRQLTGADFLPGVRVAGAGSFVAEILADGAQALVYGSGSAT
jgi:predicted peroxiredoxin